METSDWALIISCLSMIVALGSFIWNVWSKFIYPKPRVKVTISIMSQMPNPQNLPSFVSLNATNFGPNQVTLNMVRTRYKEGMLKRYQDGILSPIDNFPNSLEISKGPFSGGLPKKLEVGEDFSTYFPMHQSWLDEGLFKFGYLDSFGRFHWCSKKNSKYFLQRLKNKLSDIKIKETK